MPVPRIEEEAKDCPPIQLLIFCQKQICICSIWTCKIG